MVAVESANLFSRMVETLACLLCRYYAVDEVLFWKRGKRKDVPLNS